MNKKGLLAVSCMALLAVGAVGTVAANTKGNQFNTLFSAQATQVEVDFTTANITRRIYFVDAKDGWWQGKTLEVHVWGGSVTGDLYADASIIYGTYWSGLYYADVTGVGVGTAIKVQAHVKGYGDAQWWSADQTLPSLADKVTDVLWLNDGTDGNGKRNSEIKAAPVGAAEGKCVLDHISTCTDDYASGFNAYPQLNANFNLENVSGMDSQAIGDLDKEDHDGYNALQKINKIKALYNANGWKIAE